MSLSVKEFNIIVSELLEGETSKLTTLCTVAEKLLRKRVHEWYVNEPCLFESATIDEHDLMQEILARLVRVSVSSFLLRNGVDGPINNDAVGFEKWMFTVAGNVKKDIANKERAKWLMTKYITDHEENTIADPNSFSVSIVNQAEIIDNLNKSFSAVLNSDTEAYKKLTWLAHSLFMLNLDVDKIQSKKLVLIAFENKTLFDMYDMVFYAAKKVSWLKIAESQKERLEDALEKSFDDARVLGDVRYHELFMKKGGPATISDWVHKMNKLVKRAVRANEALDI